MFIAEAIRRRIAPRLAATAMCNEIVGNGDRTGLIVELAPSGLRIERPYFSGPSPREVQLEFELPEESDLMWAHGQVRFDEVYTQAGNLMRRTGIALVGAAARDLRLLRDYVFDRQPARDMVDNSWLIHASCYSRG